MSNHRTATLLAAAATSLALMGSAAGQQGQQQ